MQSEPISSRHFWLRKLHSLTGFLFLGLFLLYHVRDESIFDGQFSRILFLFIPLIFHGIFGLFIIREAKFNIATYPLLRNAMFVMQRITALYLVVFIVMHLADMYGDMPYSGNFWYLAFWYGGVIAAIFHLTNGIFGTAIHWGLTIGDFSQKVFVWLSFTAFIILAVYGLDTLASNF